VEVAPVVLDDRAEHRVQELLVLGLWLEIGHARPIGTRCARL
jgi:hypothetical protein